MKKIKLILLKIFGVKTANVIWKARDPNFTEKLGALHNMLYKKEQHPMEKPIFEVLEIKDVIRRDLSKLISLEPHWSTSPLFQIIFFVRKLF